MQNWIGLEFSVVHFQQCFVIFLGWNMQEEGNKSLSCKASDIALNFCMQQVAEYLTFEILKFLLLFIPHTNLVDIWLLLDAQTLSKYKTFQHNELFSGKIHALCRSLISYKDWTHYENRKCLYHDWVLELSSLEDKEGCTNFDLKGALCSNIAILDLHLLMHNACTKLHIVIQNSEININNLASQIADIGSLVYRMA